MFTIYMKTQKHARFHVFSPFSAYHYITIVKGLLRADRQPNKWLTFLVIGNDAALAHELAELVHGEVKGQSRDIHIVVVGVVNLKPACMEPE